MPIPTTPPYPPLSFSLPKVSFRKIPASEALELSVPAGVHERQNIDYGFNNGSEFVRPEHYMRHIEPAEAELKNRVEYDMDEQDQEWLDFINAERKRSQMDTISYEVFEILMDRIEKEWFDLMKRVPKKATTSAGDGEGGDSVEDTRCAICDDGECENSNAIVFCDGCNLAAHQDCYGIPYIPEGQWLCRKCTVSPDRAVSCLLCPHEGGAFKQTSNGKWAHLLCAIWIPETGVSNPVYMEPIDSIEQIPKARWKLQCYLCRQKMGACIQCDNRNCYTAFHVTCAREAGLLLKFNRQRADSHGHSAGTVLHADSAHAANISLSDDEDTGPEVLRACCEKHLPKEVREERERLGIRYPTFLNLRGEDDDTPTGSRASTPGGRGADIGADASSRKKKGKAPSGLVAVNGSSRHTNGDATPSGRTSKAARAYKKSYRAGPPLVPKYILDRVMEYTHKIRIRAKPQFVAQLARFWSLKREARRGAPLLKRLHLEPWTAAPVPKEQAESEKTKKLQFLKLLREDLERVRMLAELSRKREREKHKQIEVLRSVLVGNFLFPYANILRKAFSDIISLDRQGLFASPVSRADVPDYYDIIKTPMDWSQISPRLDQNAYASVAALKKDVLQVFTNARIYNKPDTAYHKLATKMENAATPIFQALEEQFATVHAEENSKTKLAIQAWKDEQEAMRRENGPALSEEDLERMLERLETDLTLHFEPDLMLLNLIEDPELCAFEKASPDAVAGPNAVDTETGAHQTEATATQGSRLNFIDNLLRQDITLSEEALLDGLASLTPEIGSVDTMPSAINRKKKSSKRSRTRTTHERPQKRRKTAAVSTTIAVPELPAAGPVVIEPKPAPAPEPELEADAEMDSEAERDHTTNWEPEVKSKPEAETEAKPAPEAAHEPEAAQERGAGQQAEAELPPESDPEAEVAELAQAEAEAEPEPQPQLKEPPKVEPSPPGEDLQRALAATNGSEESGTQDVDITIKIKAPEPSPAEPEVVAAASPPVQAPPPVPTNSSELTTVVGAKEAELYAGPAQTPSTLSSALSTPVIAQEPEPEPEGRVAKDASSSERVLSDRRSVAGEEPTNLEVSDVTNWDTFKRFNTGWVLPAGSKRQSRPSNLNESKLTVDRGPKEVAARMLSKGKGKETSSVEEAKTSTSHARTRTSDDERDEPMDGSSDLSSVSSSDSSDLSDADDESADEEHQQEAGPSSQRTRPQRKRSQTVRMATDGEPDLYKRDRNGRFSKGRRRVVSQPLEDDSEEEEDDEEEEEEEEGDDDEGEGDEEEDPATTQEDGSDHADEQDKVGVGSSSFQLHRSASLQSSKSREDRSSSRRRGRVKVPRAKAQGEGEPEDFVDGTMVWAKITGYPFSPAVIVEPELPHAIVPKDVLRSAREPDEIHLVRFYGQKVQWRWMPTRKLRFMFEDDDLDQKLMKAPDGRTPHSKALVREAYKLALAEKE
ncbi:hypothetical protein OC842_000209 [Tilletia horrida]|uniref:Peregrin n=1 Tax=Tilletia horrida TaxID=155126 RepID=A0AAN6GM90_9BASI|nr:hypothetical protein OC842_000209 [Tilletia horrida]